MWTMELKESRLMGILCKITLLSELEGASHTIVGSTKSCTSATN